MNFPVFDLHCDTAQMLWHNWHFEGHPDKNLRRNNCHVDLERAGNLSGLCQCFACFTTSFMSEGIKITPEIVFENELSVLRQALQENADIFRQAFTAEDVVYNQRNGYISAIFTIEGAAGIGFDPGRLEEMYELGFRITSLGWNEKNPLTGSHVTGGGLTDLGREYVKEAQRIGMIVDVSHISDEGFWDIIKITEAPIVATHSNSRAVWNASRNLTDDMFCAICETGGVAGMNLYGDFLGQSPTLHTVCDHILHLLNLDPDGTHLALGGDLDGCSVLPAEFSGVQDYPKLSDCLLARGLNEDTVYNIFWKNALGVIARCCT